jgi:hypothetical protein
MHVSAELVPKFDQSFHAFQNNPLCRDLIFAGISGMDRTRPLLPLTIQAQGDVAQPGFAADAVPYGPSAALLRQADSSCQRLKSSWAIS